MSCNGQPTDFATSGVTWVYTYDGTNASFAETVEGCTLTSSGTVSCQDGVFTTLFSNPNTCSPASCAIWGTACTETPGPSQSITWSISQQTGTTFVSTTENEPDGGPTPLTTCTSLGDQNPVQVTWTKQ